MCWLSTVTSRWQITAEMTAAEGGNAVAASYDVTSFAQCAAMVKEAVSRWDALAVAATERAQGRARQWRWPRSAASLSRSRSHAYRFAELRTDAADIMSTIELVDLECAMRSRCGQWSH